MALDSQVIPGFRFGALFTLLLSAVFTLGAALIVAPVATADEETWDAPSISITELSPEILTDEDALQVRVNLSGVGPTSPVRVQLFMKADPFDSFDEVTSYMEGAGGYGWVAADYELDDAERLRASRPEGIELDLEVPVEALPLWNEAAWGPYGFEVRATNAGGPPGMPPPSDHSVLIWYPPGSEGTTALNMLLPSSMEPGAVATVLQNVREGVTMAMTPPQARAFLTDPRGAGAETIVLPDQRADMSMLASVGQLELYRLASESRVLEDVGENPAGLGADGPGAGESPSDDTVQSGDSAPQSGDMQDRPSTVSDRPLLVQDVILASDGWLSKRLLQAAGSDVVLAPPGGLERTGRQGLTPSSKIQVSKNTGLSIEEDGEDAVTLLDSWQPMAKLMAASPQDSSHLDIRQQIRALTALVTTEDPSALRHLWVNIPNTVNATALGERLDAALEAPWVRSVTLEQILNAPASHPEISPIDEATFGDLPTTSALMEELGTVLSLAEAVTEASPNGPEALEEASSTFLYPTAAGITLDERANRVAQVVPELVEEFDIIEVAPTRTVNVMNSNADFPVTLANRGTFPVTVEVGLETEDARLQPKRWVEVTVPTSGTVIAQIPVAAVGSGDVNVLVVAKTPAGTILDASQNVDVRVRAGAEDTLMWVVAGIVGALFILGLIRTLRKGRRPANQPRIRPR